MVREYHPAARSLGLTNAPDLLERLRSIDGWLIDASSVIYVVRPAV